MKILRMRYVALMVFLCGVSGAVAEEADRAGLISGDLLQVAGIGTPALTPSQPAAGTPDTRLAMNETAAPEESADLPDDQTSAAPTPGDTSKVGRVTGLPLPRFVSMKSSEANIRRGPSMTHRIDWQFLRRGMPVEVIAEYGHWRQIRDHDGAGGWVHYALISGRRTALIEKDMLALHAQPDDTSRVVAKLQQGVIADLEECNEDWCRLSVSGYEGWAPKTSFWGAGKDETFH